MSPCFVTHAFFDGYCSTVQGLLDWFDVSVPQPPMSPSPSWVSTPETQENKKIFVSLTKTDKNNKSNDRWT